MNLYWIIVLIIIVIIIAWLQYYKTGVAGNAGNAGNASDANGTEKYTRHTMSNKLYYDDSIECLEHPEHAGCVTCFTNKGFSHGDSLIMCNAAKRNQQIQNSIRHPWGKLFNRENARKFIKFR